MPGPMVMNDVICPLRTSTSASKHNRLICCAARSDLFPDAIPLEVIFIGDCCATMALDESKLILEVEGERPVRQRRNVAICIV